MLLVVTLAIGGCCLVAGGLAIDCFHCVSLGGNNRDCDDPFHNNGSLGFLQSPCLGGRKGRDGLFPATACVKIAGVYYDTGVSLTVRSCALDSGTLTTDSELIRMSHCGGFYYENRYLKGCVQSCSDADACNGSEPSGPLALGYLALGSSLLILHSLVAALTRPQSPRMRSSTARLGCNNTPLSTLHRTLSLQGRPLKRSFNRQSRAAPLRFAILSTLCDSSD